MCSKRLVKLRLKARDFYSIEKALGLIQAKEYNDEIEFEAEIPDDKKTMEFLVTSPEVLHWDFIEQPKSREYTIPSGDAVSASVHEPGVDEPRVVFSYSGGDVQGQLDPEDPENAIELLMEKYGSEYLTVASILRIVLQFKKFYTKSPALRFTSNIITSYVIKVDVEVEFEEFRSSHKDLVDKLIVHLRNECTGEPNAYYDYQYLIRTLKKFWLLGKLSKENVDELLTNIYGVLE